MLAAVAAGHSVLVPNTELAAALSARVERLYIEAGRDVWPTPLIRDFSGWLRDQYLARQSSDPTLPRCLSDIEEREVWRSVILERESDRTLLEPAGAARAARRARRALFDYQIPLAALADHATEEVLAFLEWNRRFEQRCAELGCISAFELPAFLPAGAPAIAWIDSPLWRPAARRWLESLGVSSLPPLTAHAAAHPNRVAAPSPAAELAAMAEWACDNLRSNPRFRAWICIPDLPPRRAAAQDAFDAVLAPARLTLAVPETLAVHAVAGGISLADYAPVRATLHLLSAAQGAVSFTSFSQLLRMPELHASPAAGAAAAVLDIALRERGRETADLAGWLRLAAQCAHDADAAVLDVLQRLTAWMQILDAVHGPQPMSRWVSVWLQAFLAAPWRDRQHWSSREYQSAERFRELLTTLATADRVFGARSAESAVRLLQRATRDTAFQVQTGVPPIWISGQLTDPWLDYDGLWIAGCDEDRWPPPLDPEPLLPVSLQRRHGVVAAGLDSQLRFAGDLQRRWQSRASACIFSCAEPADGRATPRASSRGASASFSPLLPPAATLEIVARTQPHWRVQAEAAPSFEMRVDAAAPLFSAAERLRGVAALRAQSRCAFRGFAEARLLAAPLDQPVPGFHQRERGEMLHHALEALWRQLRSSAGLAALAPELRESMLAAGAKAAVAAQCRRRDPGERWQRREVARLRSLLDSWLEVELLREPFEVVELEEGQGTARHGGLEFHVRIDRIDRLADGSRVLIDYKTGAAQVDWRGDRPDNPQLPIYALLRPEALVAVAYGKINAGDCRFVCETERSGLFKPRRRATPLEGCRDFADLVALWSRRIEKIATEFAAGNAVVAPTVHACASCRLQPLCRIPSALDAGTDD